MFSTEPRIPVPAHLPGRRLAVWPAGQLSERLVKIGGFNRKCTAPPLNPGHRRRDFNGPNSLSASHHNLSLHAKEATMRAFLASLVLLMTASPNLFAAESYKVTDNELIDATKVEKAAKLFEEENGTIVQAGPEAFRPQC